MSQWQAPVVPTVHVMTGSFDSYISLPKLTHLHLHSDTQDRDTGVAGEAENALIAYVAAHAAAFQDLITGSSPAGAELLRLADEGSSTQRMRVFALLTAAAAATNSSNVEQLKQSGKQQQQHSMTAWR